MAFFGLFGNRNRTRTHVETNQLIDDIIGNDQSRNPPLNSEYGTFRSIQREINDIITNSQVSKALDDENAYSNTADFFNVTNYLGAVPVLTNKNQRLQEWRRASAYPEVDFCLREIADDFIHEDENGDFIHLTINDNKDSLNSDRQEILQNEFKKYIAMFNLKRDYFKIVKRFLIEGELAWENIIDPEHPNLGIKAVKFIPAEYYESLVDPRTGEKVGIFIDAQKLKLDIHSIVSNSYYNAYKAFNAVFGTTINSYSSNSCIPFLWPQLTYIASSETTPDGMIPLSLIERCKQPYYQLAMMHDAAVVMRVTRSPEKLLFNIDVGQMPMKLAMDKVNRFARNLNTKKIVANPNELAKDNPDGTPNITSVYHPSSMNTAWVFAKQMGSEGTSVETVGSTANFEQIEDIDYFLRRLLKQATVPYSRYKTPENTMEKNDAITYEEYAFSRQEMRFQSLFSNGFLKGFITHLKLRELWNKYNLRESDLNIAFTPPVLYDLYQNQKLMEAKVAAYATLADREEFSKIYAMETVLKMTPEEIKKNYDNLLYEALLMKKIEWAQDQLGEKGPKDKALPIPLEGDKEENPEDGEEGEPTEEKNEEENEGSEETPSSTSSEKNEEESPSEETTPDTFGLSNA